MKRQFNIYLFLLLSVVIPVQAQLNTDRIMTIGRNAMYFEDYVLSIQYFNQVIKAKPHLAEPYLFRAIAKFYLDDYLGAKQDCDRALDINPFLIDAYNIRGISLQRLGQFELSAEDFSRGLKYEPFNTSLIMNKGVSKMAMDDFDGAISDFSEAIKLKKGFTLAYLNRGEAYMKIGDTLNAIPDFEKAIELNPYNPAGYVFRGRVHFEKKAYELAEESFDMAVRLSPDEPFFYMNRGIARYFQQDYMDALNDFDKAIELNPNSAVAYFNRGLIRAEIADNNRAVEDFTMVLNIEPDNYIALFNRGLIHNQLGNAFNAIDDFNRVIEKYPGFPPAYYARAAARKILGDQEGMIVDINTAYDLEMKAGEKKKGEKKELKDVTLAQNSDTQDKREEGDTNISNYKKIVVYDEEREKSKNKFESDIRGRIQNRNIIIDLEGSFSLSFYPEKHELDARQDYYSKVVEQFNRNSGLNKELYLTNDNQSLSEKEIEQHFQVIKTISQRIDMYPNSLISYMERALNYDMVKDFSAAIADLNDVINLKDDLAIAYFYRAALRYKTVEFVLSLEEETVPMSPISGKSDNQLITGGKGSTDLKTEKRILDYDLILHDYNKALELHPDFAFAWYNRANVRCILKDYQVAVNDYSEAIRLEPDLAEAYFNRGLTYIYLGKLQQGTRDLSKAGELGLYKAYNVLKRYGLQNR